MLFGDFEYNDVMSLLAFLIIAIISAAFVLWFFPTMDSALKKLVIAIPVILFIIWVLNLLGIINTPSTIGGHV